MWNQDPWLLALVARDGGRLRPWSVRLCQREGVQVWKKVFRFTRAGALGTVCREFLKEGIAVRAKLLEVEAGDGG